MKKITFAFILSASAFAVFSGYDKAEALSIAPSKLSFWNITQTGLTAAYNPAGGPLDAGLEEARFRKAPIYLNYRPTMCGDDPATPPNTACPAIYMAPTTVPFGYSATSNPSLLPAYVTGLKPATSYTFWISYDNGIRCATTPCPSMTDDFANRAMVSTAPASNGMPKGPLTQKLYKGVRSYEVAILQNFLISQGYLSGNADGKFGNKTYAAVKRFQEGQTSQMIRADGVVGAETRLSINSIINNVAPVE